MHIVSCFISSAKLCWIILTSKFLCCFFQQSCISLLLLIDVAKIQHFRFLPMRFVRFAWIREIKYRKYHEIILKISSKNKKITPIDKKLSPIDSKISPKNKKISPIKKIWKPCWGDEVKGEGYILNLYIIFFFRAFSIFDPRVFFRITLFFLYPRVHI